MTDFQEENKSEEWKKKLHAAFNTALTGSPNEQIQACTQVGYYYMCVAPAFLYKYYSDDLQKLETVKTNKMWYSAPCNFNDVFDCDISIDEKEIFRCILQMNSEEREIRIGSPMWKQLQETVRRQIRSSQSDFERLRTQMGISCMSEADDSLLMWAHYANNHRGMCVEYELMEINRQLKFSPIPIIYSDNRVCFRSLNLGDTSKNALNVFVENITSKSSEWSYEKEWRIIRDDSACGDKWDADKKGALLDMIRPSSVILGCEATPEFEKNVHEYCESNKIDLYKMEKDRILYRLNKKTVLQFES